MMNASATSVSNAGPETPSGAGAAGRVTLRVRNIREAVVYHLMFDGDVGRLTGAQLKQHVQSICGIPTEQQILTFNGMHVASESTGYDLGFHNGAMLVLDTVARGAGGGGGKAKALPEAFVRGSSHDASAQGANGAARQHPPPAATAGGGGDRNPTPRSRFEAELDAARAGGGAQQPAAADGGGAEYAPRGVSASRSHFHHSNSYPQQQQQHAHGPSYDGGARQSSSTNGRGGAAAYSAAGVYDDIDVDVEVTEEAGGPLWQPTNSVDVEESRLLQQDYVWKMEQVRFETERMNREREMLRQRQELEYQAELLERERIELERKTHSERLKLGVLQSTLHDEMSIEAKIGALTEESVHRQRN